MRLEVVSLLVSQKPQAFIQPDRPPTFIVRDGARDSIPKKARKRFGVDDAATAFARVYAQMLAEPAGDQRGPVAHRVRLVDQLFTFGGGEQVAEGDCKLARALQLHAFDCRIIASRARPICKVQPWTRACSTY